MTSYVPPKKNTAAIFYLSLPSYATSGAMQTNPTLAAGDVQVSTDGGAFANITTLPAVTPALGASVKVSLSAAEMNGDNVGTVVSMRGYFTAAPSFPGIYVEGRPTGDCYDRELTNSG